MAMVYVISILKLAPLILLIFVGFPHIEWAGVAGADIPGTETLGQSMLVLMYDFIGLEFSLIAAGETRNARTAIPRTIEIEIASCREREWKDVVISVEVG